MYIDEDNVDLVKNVVKQISLSSPEKVNFDVVENGIRKIKNKKTGKVTYKKVDKVEGATYIYKYIMKFNDVYTNDNTLKNQAARYFYSARGYNFFGIKLATTKFNFIIQNYKDYIDYLSSDLIEVLENYDYYNFQKHYADDFKMVRNDKKVVLFVEYNLSANNKIIVKDDEIHKSKINYYDLSSKENRKIIIKKKIFSIFEVTEDFYEDKNKIESIEDIDLNELINSNIKNAFETVIRDEEDYNNFINDYVNKDVNSFLRVNLDIKLTKSNKLMTSLNVRADKKFISFLKIGLNTDCCANKSNDLLEVRVKQSYSRKYKLPEAIYILGELKTLGIEHIKVDRAKK
ncbi:MAG TPA: hypothetical protein GXX62_04740 [Alcaligenaceae bacterium]|nr:hypothetical protein [Alcaligenaceae bacterium]